MRRHCWSVLLFVPLMLSASSRAVEPAPAEEEPIYQGKTLAEWIDDLNDSTSANNRSAGARALAVFGPKKQVVSALASALTKDDWSDAVLIAAKTLGQFGPKAKEALPALRAAYKRMEGKPPEMVKSDWLMSLRRAVAEAMILIDDHPSLEFAPILLEALGTDDADKRRDIVIKLGKLGSKAAKTTVPALIGVLTDTGKDVLRPTSCWSSSNAFPLEKIKEIRLEAVKSLGRIGPAAKPALHALTLAMKSAAPEKGSGVQLMEVPAKPATSTHGDVLLIARPPVAIDDKAMLRACAEALGRIRPEAKGTVGALRLALRDLDEGVRWAALCVLLESGQNAREVLPIVRTFLHDKDAALRRVAVEVLGKSGAETKQLLPVLTEALKDKDASVRESAAKALGAMGNKGKQVVAVLIDALNDAEAKVRAAGAEALAKMGVPDKQVIQALIALLGDKEKDVFHAASMALMKFGPQAKAAIPPLLALLHDSEAEKRSTTCLVLGSIGPSAKKALSPLAKMSKDDSAESVRLAAYAALARIDSSRLKEILPRLTAALQRVKEKDEEVVVIAAVSLIFLGREAREVLPHLNTLRDQTSDADVRKVFDFVIEGIQHPEKDAFDL